MKKEKLKKSKDTSEVIATGVAFVFGTFLLALCYNLFFVPNEIVVGGISGLGLIISKLTGINVQLFIYMAQVFCIFISYILLGKEETKKTILGSILYPLFITFTIPIARVLISHLSFQEILVTVVLAGLLYGISNGIIYRIGYSTGGGDVLIKLLCKYFHFSEGKSSIILNIFIIIFGAFIFGIDTAVYAVIILVINSIKLYKMNLKLDLQYFLQLVVIHIIKELLLCVL